MRSLKTGGGLTRGRGLTEQQRLIWLLSMPACAEKNHIMREMTGVQFNSGEQNKDMSKARRIRDMKDTVTILRALAVHNPFSLDTNNNLRNIMNGVNADSNANADTTGDCRGEDSFVDEWKVSHRLLIQTKCPGSHHGIKVHREDCR